MLESYREHKERVSARLRTLAELAGDAGHALAAGGHRPACGCPSWPRSASTWWCWASSTTARAPSSTRCWARPLLPVGITPTTATINHIILGEQPSARAVLRDGGTQEIDPLQLADYVTLEGDALRGDPLRRAELPGGDPARQGHAGGHAGGQRHQRGAGRDHLQLHPARRRGDLSARQHPGAQAQRARLHSAAADAAQPGQADLRAGQEGSARRGGARGGHRLRRRAPGRAGGGPGGLRHQRRGAFWRGTRSRAAWRPSSTSCAPTSTSSAGGCCWTTPSPTGPRTISYIRSNLGIKRQSLDLSLEELTLRVADVKTQARRHPGPPAGEPAADPERDRGDQGHRAPRPAPLLRGLLRRAAGPDRQGRGLGGQELPAALHPGQVQGVGRAGGGQGRRAARTAGRARSSRSPTRTCTT